MWLSVAAKAGDLLLPPTASSYPSSLTPRAYASRSCQPNWQEISHFCLARWDLWSFSFLNRLPHVLIGSSGRTRAVVGTCRDRCGNMQLPAQAREFSLLWNLYLNVSLFKRGVSLFQYFKAIFKQIFKTNGRHFTSISLQNSFPVSTGRNHMLIRTSLIKGICV